MDFVLSCACPPCDRVWPLYMKQVVPEGLSLHFLSLPVEEIFWRQARHSEFDVAECSLSTYTLLRSINDQRFIAIPVFTSRFFRHSCMFVNKHKGINSPQDLRGKIVGLPEYQMTAVVWLKGILQEEYGVAPKDIIWRTGGEESPGRVEKVGLDLPSDIKIKPIPADKTLSSMLDAGEIDALLTARVPSSYQGASRNVVRLFENYRDVEMDYYRKTKIFPIMHTIVLKRELYEKHSWIAFNLYKAFDTSRKIAMARCLDTSSSTAAIPWLIPEVERAKTLMGDDYWPYGIQKNKPTLQKFFEYHHQQGLSKKLMKIDDLFAPETLDDEYKV